MKDIFKIRKVSLCALYSSIILFFISVAVLSTGNGIAGIAIFILGIILLISFIVLGFLYWNCPYCHESFELRQGKMDDLKVCPFCGKKLRD